MLRLSCGVTFAPRLRPAFQQRRCFSSEFTRKASDPLRILFCGSDAFSCESLRALHREHETNRGLVESLDVMVLPPRRTGRGFKEIKEGTCSSREGDILGDAASANDETVPCKSVAEHLGLRIHQRETFRGWSVSSLFLSLSLSSLMFRS